jgi:RNA polymerase sigma factor (sigma-70 family)
LTTKTQGADARVTAMMRTHGQSLQRVARSVSLCADDADEAVQRALEIYLRRLDSVEVATEGAWMRVVVRNEALAVRKSRAQQVAGHEPELDAELASDERPVHERIESAQRVARSAEALRHLKRDEAHALMLKAEGYSYQQIGEQLGWTYTKVNRCITEGRRRFFSVYRGIETGEECDRFAPVLRALVDGGASAQDVVALRPHLRSHALPGRDPPPARRSLGGRDRAAADRAGQPPARLRRPHGG